MNTSTVTTIRNDLSLKSKNGIAFLLSGTIIWTIITIIFLLSIDIFQKNIFLFISTGLMFPMSILMAKLIKADWRVAGHPLNELGLYFNIAQFVYFPFVFWAFIQSPEQMVYFFAIITGAHFFPYGWLYNTKAYYIMAPFISIGVTLIGWDLPLSQLWLIPLTIVLLFIILICWLYIDYRYKCNNKS